ncbi:MAG: hypothetical protein II649_01475 [Kiritimatiellae bacterium]|nr:hypothetical protein [Kiritimatiellia bacterium]
MSATGKTYSWQVRTYECGPDGFATLPAICNYLQEAASLNAEALKFSKSDFNASGENISWVLTHLKVRMERFPEWEDAVSVATWPRGGRRIVAWRDFLLSDASGGTFGRATSEWMLINLDTRKIVSVPQSVFDAADTSREPVFPDGDFARLRWPAETHGASALSFRARRGDIDLNGHVNNVHYVEWMMECLPEGFRPGSCDVAFKTETLAGEEVHAEAVPDGDGAFLCLAAAPDGRIHALAHFASF